jgi:hypothetical protein
MMFPGTRRSGHYGGLALIVGNAANAVLANSHFVPTTPCPMGLLSAETKWRAGRDLSSINSLGGEQHNRHVSVSRVSRNSP